MLYVGLPAGHAETADGRKPLEHKLTKNALEEGRVILTGSVVHNGETDVVILGLKRIAYGVSLRHGRP